MTYRKRLLSESCGRGGCVKMVIQNDVQERTNYSGRREEPEDINAVALLCIRSTEQSYLALRRAAQRIRGNIRKSDTVLLSKKSCALLLPGTPLVGAQAVARRIYPLLVDVEYELQIVYGDATLTLLQQLQSTHTVVMQKDTHIFAEQLSCSKKHSVQVTKEDEPLPYLAFLASYPSQRLLHMFPYELASRYHCIPVGAERGALTLATGERLQQETVIYLRKVTQRTIFQVRCETDMIDDVLHHWQQAIAV